MRSTFSGSVSPKSELTRHFEKVTAEKRGDFMRKFCCYHLRFSKLLFLVKDGFRVQGSVHGLKLESVVNIILLFNLCILIFLNVNVIANGI